MVYVALAAVIGGVLAAFLGWIRSGEPFDKRKFGESATAAVISGLGFALAYAGDTVTARDIIAAVLAGAGVGGLAHGAIGTVKAALPK